MGAGQVTRCSSTGKRGGYEAVLMAQHLLQILAGPQESGQKLIALKVSVAKLPFNFLGLKRMTINH